MNIFDLPLSQNQQLNSCSYLKIYMEPAPISSKAREAAPKKTIAMPLMALAE
jgi:hypothetical protein